MTKAIVLWLYQRPEDASIYTRARSWRFPSTRMGRLLYGPLSSQVRRDLIQAGIGAASLAAEPDSAWRSALAGSDFSYSGIVLVRPSHLLGFEPWGPLA
eukprot:13195035-Alexandrium_andersonii.AAC.1